VRLLWTLTIILSLIGVAIVIRRLLFFGAPHSGSFAALDANSLRHPVLTTVHIIPGLLFMVLGPFQFIRRLRTRRPALHRWMGRVFIVSGLVVGTTALVMGPQMAIGGVNETVATMFFAIVFLFSLTRAFLHIRQGRVALHREWMIRAYAIGLAVATIRPIMGVFFATQGLTHLTPHDFFGTAFWLGFTAQLIAAEVWINYTRPQSYSRILQNAPIQSAQEVRK
jgi:uncharacterized membrane protein